MKRVEITVPDDEEDAVHEVIQEYEEDITSSKAENEGEDVIQFQVSLSSDNIDELAEELKDLKELESGELTIEVLEETARIEKGSRVKGGSSSISVQEMYQKAFEFASVSKTSYALIALASGIAVFGVSMENLMVVIGAMVIAPMLGPFISTSFGLVIGDRRLIGDSIRYSAESLVVATSAAFLVSLVVPLQPNALMRMIANPGFVTIPLSLFVGAAAALTFSTEAREALAGVAVAIALVPPTAVAGASLAIPDFQIFFDVSLVIVTNVTSLVLAGSLTFKVYGISPSTYYRKKVSEEDLRKALILSGVSLLLIISVVGYLSYVDYQNATAKTQVNSFIDNQMGDRVLQKSVDVNSDRMDVSIAVVNPEFSESDLEELLTNRVGRTVDVKLLEVQGSVEDGGG
ncbi:MAG: TIGR00341 family protein [Candidatus Nanohaloarchaeota archaeon QJJ-7]|nr:TIGR00341 family protein [Candidatus Nanohaloarchaeota archaeon QJJ-7]